MKRAWILAVGMAVGLAGGGARPASAQTVYGGGTYSQNFDILANTSTGIAWADNSTLTGWYSNRTTYNAGTGSSNTGALYSFGTNGGTPSTERALGSVASSGTGTVLYGVRIRNSTGGTLTSFQLSYRGEQWRNGNNTTAQQLPLSISFDASSLATGTYADKPLLGFTGPVATTTAGPLDGNSNFVSVSGTVTGITWANNTDLWIRWTDIDDTGNDHGLAIDDFNFSASGDASVVPEPSALSLLLPALCALGLVLRRRNHRPDHADGALTAFEAG